MTIVYIFVPNKSNFVQRQKDDHKTESVWSVEFR